MTTDIDFRRMSFAEAKKLSEGKPRFIIDGIVSATSTLLYGEAKVGKSFLVSALVASLATGTEFLGREVEDREWKVAICVTDDDGYGEYVERIETVTVEGTEMPVEFFELPVMRSRAYWVNLFNAVIDGGFTFVVVDNLTQAAGGSVNDDSAIRDFFEGIRMFTRAGIPVVIVGHSSEKSSDRGKSQLPMGSSAISQSVRHRIFVSRSRGNLNLRFSGNHVEAHSMTLEHGIGARFTVVEKKDAQAVKDEAEAKKRERSTKTLDKNETVARWVVANCQGKGRNATAAAIAEHFGGSVNTAKSNLSGRSAYGCLLASNGGTGWTLAGPLAEAA